jgi:hypothetical protein
LRNFIKKHKKTKEMANKQSGVDKSKPITVSFSELMKLGLSKNTEWPGKIKILIKKNEVEKINLIK